MKRDTLRGDELTMIIALVATLNPIDYDHDDVQAVIYRCKGLIANPPDRLRVVDR